MTASEILTSGVAWLRLQVDLDARKMHAEACALSHRFVPHRLRSGVGWASICLHGLAEDKTEEAKKYGYESDANAPLHWTSAADHCPTIQAFVRSLPLRKLFRVRIMRLDPGGYILPHRDTLNRLLGPINVALNNPVRCLFRVEGAGLIPFTPGAAFLLDVSRQHALVNLSDDPRYHLIIHSQFHDDYHVAWRQLLERSIGTLPQSSVV